MNGEAFASAEGAVPPVLSICEASSLTHAYNYEPHEVGRVTRMCVFPMERRAQAPLKGPFLSDSFKFPRNPQQIVKMIVIQ